MRFSNDIIELVDHLIHQADEQNASDIHIEPDEHACRIRFRQDGLLCEITEIALSLAEQIITRLKVMANLDIAEHRLPQDGRFKVQNHQQRAIDIRISTCPLIHGEKIVLRLLDSAKVNLSIEALGFTSSQQKLFLKHISQTQGLILLTGPTGSGKSLTLYSALNHLNVKEKNIVTVEDPVELPIKGLNQVHVNSKAGLDFSTTLRAFLRQDPDIIMLGEIRDRETAEIALQAAHTGHLVLASLHANNAIEALTRLLSMGLASYQLAPATQLIIAQRLVRKLCPHCKMEGCIYCRQGYLGRTGIFECLNLSPSLKQLILQKTDSASLLAAARQEGFRTLNETGLEKVHQGLTTLAEINRVLSS